VGALGHCGAGETCLLVIVEDDDLVMYILVVARTQKRVMARK
jgi:hypothetical protein